MSKAYLEVGQIIGVRGILGELKVKSFCDSPSVFCGIEKFYFSPGSLQTIDIIQKKVFKNNIVVKINNIKTVNEASQLVGKVIYSCRCDIPLVEGQYFISDIIGMDVIDINTKEIYGKVLDVIQTGANDVYVIKDIKSKEILIPAINDVIKSVDLNESKIFICPIRGMFND